ncbi:hypothetical protein K502DRAFT_94512 [Neoconidiobolus thromboides FSU 785]|nr:hypothetical protein K502DRAFT_94512 [Neoconidiobolus thromboides FSU 785]
MKRKDQQYRKENEKGYKSKEGDITLTQEEEYKQYQKKLREEKKREKQLDEQAKLLELELEALLNEEVEESVKEVENVKEEIIIEEKKEVKYKRYSQFALPGMIKVEKGWVYPDEIVTERNKTFIMNKVDEIPLKKEPEPEVKQELKEEERKKEEEITEEIKVEPVKIKVKENIGLKLLRKQGWKEGTGLGKNNTGIIEPITRYL